MYALLSCCFGQVSYNCLLLEFILWRLWWFTPKDAEKIKHPIVNKVQELYFSCKSGDQDKTGNSINTAVDACGI